MSKMGQKYMSKIGSLRCIDMTSGPHRSDSTSGSHRSDTASGSHRSDTASGSPVVILFHGFGADASDLQSLSEFLAPDVGLRWIFPQGTLEVPIGPGWMGRAWWNIDIMAFEEATRRGDVSDMVQRKPSELISLREKVFQLVQELKTPWDQIILGGFSQGAMLATDIFLNAPSSPKGLMVFSGALINKKEWKELINSKSQTHFVGKRFFLSHGKQDPVLSIKGSYQLETLLCEGKMKGTTCYFDGGHEINPLVIERADQYLKEIID